MSSKYTAAIMIVLARSYASDLEVYKYLHSGCVLGHVSSCSNYQLISTTDA